MVDINIKVKGTDKTIANIKNVQTKVEEDLILRMAEIAHKVSTDAQGFAPVDTGFLKSKINGIVIRKGVTYIARIRSGAPYSIYQEFGTTRHRAQPFMRPALSKNKIFIQETLRKSLLDVLLRAQTQSQFV